MNSEFLVVGHRGWPSRYPDNTLSGLLAASRVADAVEIDVRRSGDGRLVLSHDPVLGGLPVASTRWSELCEVDLGDGHHPALLDEVLPALPDTPVQIEVKNWPLEPGFEPDHRIALEAAERARPGDVVTGFNPESLRAVRRVFPDSVTGLCITSGYPLADAVESCLDAGHAVLVAHSSQVTAHLNVDIDVFAWTVNDPDRGRELVEHGVAGIITDDPGLLAATLRSDR